MVVGRLLGDESGGVGGVINGSWGVNEGLLGGDYLALRQPMLAIYCNNWFRVVLPGQKK